MGSAQARRGIQSRTVRSAGRDDLARPVTVQAASRVVLAVCDSPVPARPLRHIFATSPSARRLTTSSLPSAPTTSRPGRALSTRDDTARLGSAVGSQRRRHAR